MSDLICRKSMARCLTPGMCSPHGGCQPDKTEWQSGYDEGRRMGTKHMYAEVDRLKAENEALRKDASRWRAFITCARIKFFGWAGYGEKDPYGNSPGNYRHFGGEFWTIHDAPTADKEKAAEILNGFADAAVAAMGKGEQS